MTDVLLVSFDDPNDKDIPILLVGRKRLNESVEIINAFQGEDARDIYKRLMKVKSKADVNVT